MKGLNFLMAAALCVATLGATSNAALAQSGEGGVFSPKNDGRFMVRLRGIVVEPDEELSSGQLDGESADISTAVVPEIDFTFFVTDNIAFELIAATAPHDVDGRGSLSGVDLGEVWLLPPTLTAQYHVTQLSDVVKPYLGAGVNYTIFYNEEQTDLGPIDYDNAFGLALQAGVDVRVAEGVYLNADVKKIFLETEWEIDTAGPGKVTGDVTIDPWIFGVGVGYRF